ncbi:hypothetical protein TCAL_09912 [Tigriopus californicus]|uniref:PID domain-containing protein n=1 Tax=Tigriopus californicus TaxID=6832 RepID=A0A553P7F9_TIGCA|nr:hypothetical protein TCAL_09912 [Tigriopus californicus]
MGDREFEELLVNSAHRQYEPRIIPSHLNTSPRNYQLVHAITPLEENKSFLEKVQLGEVLCGIPEEDRLYPSFTNHNPPPASTYSQLQHSIETRFQNLPPRHIWSSSEDEEDEDEDELEECVLEACRKPTIRWSDRCSTQELKTTKIGGSHSETQSKNALVKTTPLWSNNVNNNNTNSRNDDNNHSHNNVKIASGNTTNTNASSSKKPVSNSIRPQGQQSSSCNNETFQRSRRRRQLPEVPKDKKRDDELGMLDSGEDGPAYDSGNSTSHSPDEHQLMQRSLLLNNSFTTTLEGAMKSGSSTIKSTSETFLSQTLVCQVSTAFEPSTSDCHSEAFLMIVIVVKHHQQQHTDYDPASLTSPQCDGFEMGGRQLPRVPIQYPPTRRVTPLFILPKKLELLDPTHRGLHRFIPRHYDEVEIDIGDPVYVQKEAEDLWCEGANLRSGKIGIFPLAHVVDVEYNDFDPNGVNSERKERYLLEYIGSVESHLYKGNAVLCQAVKKIVGAKVAPKKHACVIEISDKGIKMIDKSRLNLSRHPNQDYFYSLKNVTFCGFHPSNSQYLGFVTKHPKLPKYACHVFVGEGSTQHVAEACGRAFNRFYQKFIETAYPVEDIYLE